MTGRRAILVLPLILSACAPSPSRGAADSHPPEAPLVSRLLDREHQLLKSLGDARADADYEKARATLDAVLRRADSELTRLPVPRTPQEVFARIDTLLTDMDFVLCIKTSTLHDMLVAQPLSSCAGSRANGDGLFTVAREAASRRHADLRAAGHEPLVHFFDCDLGSLIYIAIAEHRSLPVSMSELPDHNWVRWINQDGTYVNWDVNEGRTYSDDEFRRGTQTAIGCNSDCTGRIDNMFFHTFTPHDIEGYHYTLLYGIASKNGIDKIAADLLRRSLELAPKGATAANNLAWVLAVSPAFTSPAVGAEAEKMANRAVDLSESTEHLDTLSCAQAAAGHFQAASATERRARKKQTRLDWFAQGEDCRGREALRAPSEEAPKPLR